MQILFSLPLPLPWVTTHCLKHQIQNSPPSVPLIPPNPSSNTNEEENLFLLLPQKGFPFPEPQAPILVFLSVKTQQGLNPAVCLKAKKKKTKPIITHANSLVEVQSRKPQNCLPENRDSTALLLEADHSYVMAQTAFLTQAMPTHSVTGHPAIHERAQRRHASKTYFIYIWENWISRERSHLSVITAPLNSRDRLWARHTTISRTHRCSSQGPRQLIPALTIANPRQQDMDAKYLFTSTMDPVFL